MKTNATLLGLAIGDALGMPFEFSDTIKIIQAGWDGSFLGGMWNLKAGSWTDDTKLALCLTNSLLESNGFDINNLAQKYIDWVKSGDLRGIGVTCERAIANLANGISPKESGKKNIGRAKPSFKRVSAESEKTGSEDTDLIGFGNYCGNGVIMRQAPAGIFFKDDPSELERAVKEDATMTHDHPDARDGGLALCTMIAALANGATKLEALETASKLKYEFDHTLRHMKNAVLELSNNNTPIEVGEKLGVRGTSHETLATALYCFLKHDNFKDAIVEAVLIAGDSDSRGAITGALAGTFYGLEGIPEYYVNNVEDSDKLRELDVKLMRGKI